MGQVCSCCVQRYRGNLQSTQRQLDQQSSKDEKCNIYEKPDEKQNSDSLLKEIYSQAKQKSDITTTNGVLPGITEISMDYTVTGSPRRDLFNFEFTEEDQKKSLHSQENMIQSQNDPQVNKILIQNYYHEEVSQNEEITANFFTPDQTETDIKSELISNYISCEEDNASKINQQELEGKNKEAINDLENEYSFDQDQYQSELDRITLSNLDKDQFNNEKIIQFESKDKLERLVDEGRQTASFNQINNHQLYINKSISIHMKPFQSQHQFLQSFDKQLQALIISLQRINGNRSKYLNLLYRKIFALKLGFRTQQKYCRKPRIYILSSYYFRRVEVLNQKNQVKEAILNQQ